MMLHWAVLTGEALCGATWFPAGRLRNRRGGDRMILTKFIMRSCVVPELTARNKADALKD